MHFLFVRDFNLCCFFNNFKGRQILSTAVMIYVLYRCQCNDGKNRQMTIKTLYIFFLYLEVFAVTSITSCFLLNWWSFLNTLSTELFSQIQTSTTIGHIGELLYYCFLILQIRNNLVSLSLSLSLSLSHSLSLSLVSNVRTLKAIELCLSDHMFVYGVFSRKLSFVNPMVSTFYV